MYNYRVYIRVYCSKLNNKQLVHVYHRSRVYASNYTTSLSLHTCFVLCNSAIYYKGSKLLQYTVNICSFESIVRHRVISTEKSLILTLICFYSPIQYRPLLFTMKIKAHTINFTNKFS